MPSARPVQYRRSFRQYCLGSRSRHAAFSLSGTRARAEGGSRGCADSLLDFDLNASATERCRQNGVEASDGYSAKNSKRSKSNWPGIALLHDALIFQSLAAVPNGFAVNTPPATELLPDEGPTTNGVN